MNTTANSSIANPPIDSQLVRALRNGFALTAEIVPPLSGNPEDFLKLLDPFKGHVDAVNLADSAGGKVRLPGLACAALMKGQGVAPVLQVTCRDRNKIALISDLIGAGAIGVKNLLVLRGDKLDEQKQAGITSVHDVDPTDLISIVSTLSNTGVIPNEEKPVTSPPQFFIAAADMPNQCDESWWGEALNKKVDAGAQFLQTQLTYDLKAISHYAEKLHEVGLRDKIFVLIGTGPLASAKSALWMRENLWGVDVPDEIITRLQDADDPKQEGINICAEILQHIAETPGLHGAHLMAPGNNASIPKAITLAGLSKQRSLSA